MDLRDMRGTGGASIPNRVRFMKRARDSVRRIVEEVLKGGNVITDKSGGKKVSIPTGGIDEPSIRKSETGGNRQRILPGNERFVEGDRIARPDSGQGGDGNGDQAGKGDSTDAFQFVISREEFLQLFFEDCELPHLIKRSAGDIKRFLPHRAGFSKSGSSSQMDLLRTMRQSLGRRRALSRPSFAELAALQNEIVDEEEKFEEETERLVALRALYDQLLDRYNRVPFIEPDHDVRYRRFERTPKLITRAVMFCLMDVSGSMTQERKNNAKRFFLLLNLFLSSRYKYVEVVFIRHTVQAQEVDEETFFHSQETGGTAVSSVLAEMQEIIRQRYLSEWNIYAAQASDGDNDDVDTEEAVKRIAELLLKLQYYAYIEVKEGASGSTLWRAYEQVNAKNFAMKRVHVPEDVVGVFYQFFGRNAQKEKLNESNQ